MRRSLFMVMLAGCTAVAGPSGVTARDGEPIDLRITEALRCRPTSKWYCATLQDSLAAAESALPRTAVLSASKTETGYKAWVIRSKETVRDGAFFLYEFDPKMMIVARHCFSGIPTDDVVPIQKLSVAHLSWGQGLLSFDDVCRVEDECGAFGASRDYSLEDGKATQTRERASVSIPGGVAGCPYNREIMRIPPSELRVLRIRSGSAFVVRSAGTFPELHAGSALKASEEIVLTPFSKVELEVSGLPIEFQAGSVPIRMQFVADESLTVGWHQVRKILANDEADGGFIWTNPFLRSEKVIFEISRDEAKKVCDHYRRKLSRISVPMSVRPIFDGTRGVFIEAAWLVEVFCEDKRQD